MKIIRVDDNDFIDELEVSHYEFNSYTNMLDYSKENGYNDEYWDIWQQYMEVYVEYTTLKEKLRVNYIVPAVGENYPGWWEINFERKEIYIHKN